MDIIIENTYSRIENGSDSEIGRISEALKYEIPGRTYGLIHHIEKDHIPKLSSSTAHAVQRAIQRVRRKKQWEDIHREAISLFPHCGKCTWDWNIRFVKKNKFPTGLINDVIEIVPDANIIDLRVKPSGTPIPNSVELRDYQYNAYNAIIKHYIGIVEIPTGGGKTEIAIKTVCDIGVNTLIVVPTTIIFNEFVDKFKTYAPDLDLGIIASGVFSPKHITLSIFDDSWSKSQMGIEFASTVEFLYVDEGHKSAAKTWYEYFMTLENAYYRISQTATPFRDNSVDIAKMHACTGPKIFSLKTNDLQNQGWLSKADVKFIRVNCPLHTGSYTNKYRYTIVQNNIRNKIIKELAIRFASEKKRCLIIVNWKEHAQILIEMLKDALTDVVYFNGGMTVKKLHEAKERFLNDCYIAIGTPVVDMGFNVPTIDVLILAGGGRSPGIAQQRLGRSLRIADNKTIATVFDFYDCDHDTFESHSNARISIFKKLKQNVSIINVQDI